VKEATPLPPRVAELLSMVGRRLGLDHPREVGALWGRWREIVGDDVAAHAEPSSLRAGLLRVRTDSPAWATEISYLADEIKRRANETVGRELVSEVRVWTGPGPIGARAAAPAPASANVRPGPPADVAADPVDALERARRAWLRRRSS
jgi:predicted nucleic acid-binding Zn ribbon protein